MTSRMTQHIRILLVDSYEVVRVGLRTIMEQQPGLEVVGEASSREETLRLVEHELPDVIVLDLDLGSESGLDLIPHIHMAAPQAHILVLTGISDTLVHQQAIRLGAIGLVQKAQGVQVLLKAIERVAIGEAWLDPSLVASVLSDLSRVRRGPDVHPEATKMAMLTEREHEVIGLICEGLQNRGIGQRLCIAETTVRHHLTSIFTKLGLESRLELVIYAYRNGLAKVHQ